MTNPFRYREPLSGETGFFNRVSEKMRIGSRIGADRPQSVSIVGELQVGKTSLVNWLCDPAAQADFLDSPVQYVFLSLDLSADPPKNTRDFFERVDRTWQQNGGGGMTPTYDGFNEMVKGLMQEGKKLVLFLDDFGLVTQNSGFPLDFFSFMRSLANSNDVAYVTTSAVDLQKLCHTQDIEESPFFNIFTTVHLEPFKEKDARGLVETLAGEGDVEFGDATDWIVELAGGSPYLLQLTASQAYEAQSGGKVDRQNLADEAFREARGYLEKLWGKHFSSVQQEVLRAVCRGKKVERRQEYAAESLERRGHLTKVDDGYAIRAGLLRRYVEERGSGGFLKRLFG